MNNSYSLLILILMLVITILMVVAIYYIPDITQGNFHKVLWSSK